MYTRSILPTNRSYFLLGPRGTGKTTWVNQFYSGANRYDLLKPSEFLRLNRNPGVFRQEIEALPKNSVIIIDEIQKNPILLDDVHYFLAQTSKKFTFVLTGSSARKLKKQGSNLLAGRASQKSLFPLIYDEHRDLENIENILKFGTLPEVFNFKKNQDKIEFLESYATLYLKEEVMQEGAAKSLDSFSRFLQVAAIMNGQLTNISSLSRDSGVGRTTINGYYEVLIDTLVGTWLQSWQPRLRVKEVEHPKFYFFDPGVVRALSGKLKKNIDDFEKGFLLETYILHELRAWKSYKNLDYEIHFWRTPSKIEIDFVLEIDSKKIAIEVKSSSTWKKESGKAIKGLLEKKAVHKGYGIYLGQNTLKDGQMTVLPLKTFLQKLYKQEL